MASNVTAFQKVLDSTALAATKFIRRPPIDPKVPIQGKIRVVGSNAYRDQQEKEGRRLQKALNSIAHGKNIFVYHNIRTKQVVYSLTRYLEKTNLLKQCVNHGKKTIPATVRKDMWVPYFSVHFNEAQVGLNVYNHLRQFALLRQLSPPKEMITVTKEYLDSKRPKDLRDQKQWDKENMGRVGQIMMKKERAYALMNQKATSIADVAFVLQKHRDHIIAGFPESTKSGYKTVKARRRRRSAAEEEAERSQARAAEVAALGEQLDAEITADHVAPREQSVKILWQEPYDAQYAKYWPKHVEHGQLRWTRNHIVGQEELVAGEDVIADGTFEEVTPART
ncbi:Mitochondrial homologous recombination protein 1 [Penicillium bovifimosum]|uniref:Large ribosomal subunit protein mL67 n=1 Tax=Penicillium bovifimosum TaxID=126998 RepID=A0A9W9GH43_9EURO|nr:Mitochondrial homologous recombination protein 1 [Penicillium bovifimosum]KAJ5120345.1 Mitochondrial homologous recombination protein 1 [Penicillium bovifimosum]